MSICLCLRYGRAKQRDNLIKNAYVCVKCALHWMLILHTQVAEAEKKKAEAHAEHQRKAHIFNKIDLEVSTHWLWTWNFDRKTNRLEMKCSVLFKRNWIANHLMWYSCAAFISNYGMVTTVNNSMSFFLPPSDSTNWRASTAEYTKIASVFRGKAIVSGAAGDAERANPWVGNPNKEYKGIVCDVTEKFGEN